MSWLNNITDLAGKAESLLNNIDQSAAVAISKAAVSSDESHVEKNASNQVVSIKQGQSSSKSVHSTNINEAPKISRAKAQTFKREAEKSQNPKTSDDALFDFLNSSNKVTKSRSVPVTPRPTKLPREVKTASKAKSSLVNPDPLPKDHSNIPATFEISRSSSFDSLNSKRSNSRKISDNGSDPHETNSEPDNITFPTDSTASESDFELVGSIISKSDRDSPSSSSQGSASDLAVENRLLRSEITSLHQELTQTTRRNRKIKEDMQHENRDLKNHCDDLEQQIKVKTTQVSALNMNLSELNELLKVERNNTSQLRAENERILVDQSEGSGMHTRAIDELRTRLSETENALAEARSAHSHSQQEIIELRSRQEHESKKVVETLHKSDAEKIKDKKVIDELNLEIKSLRTNLNVAKQELTDYKQKAARILQSKERLISSLKGGEESDMTSSTIASLELEETKQERDAVRDDLRAARMELSSLKIEFQDAEQQFHQDQSILQEEVNGLRRDLEEESRGRQEAESELHRLQEEGRRDREENSRTRAHAQSRLHDKDMEIERLRNQLMLRSQSTPQESELESRLRQLTEAIIQKQSLVETLAAEKSSLTLRLERMEGQVKRLSQESGNQVNVRMDDDVTRGRGNFSANMLEFPSMGSQYGVVRKVKKAASALDHFSIRLGVFLKRYPPARLFVLIYMGILHIWVMIVLLTYTPETHDEDFLKALEHGAKH